MLSCPLLNRLGVGCNTGHDAAFDELCTAIKPFSDAGAIFPAVGSGPSRLRPANAAGDFFYYQHEDGNIN